MKKAHKMRKLKTTTDSLKIAVTRDAKKVLDEYFKEKVKIKFELKMSRKSRVQES